MTQKLNKFNHFERLIEFTIQKEKHDGIKRMGDSKQRERVACNNQAAQATARVMAARPSSMKTQSKQ